MCNEFMYALRDIEAARAYIPEEREMGIHEFWCYIDGEIRDCVRYISTFDGDAGIARHGVKWRIGMSYTVEHIFKTVAELREFYQLK